MTRLLASLRIALRALLANKMRSALTMLGIIIGVSAVITMIAVGSGAKQRIEEQIASMGSNLLLVDSGSSSSGGFRMGAGSAPTLTVADAKAIETEIPGVKYVAPSARGAAQVVYGNQNWSTGITGTSPNGTTAEEAKASLRAKEAVVVNYFKEVWNINFYSLQSKSRAAIEALIK